MAGAIRAAPRSRASSTGGVSGPRGGGFNGMAAAGGSSDSDVSNGSADRGDKGRIVPEGDRQFEFIGVIQFRDLARRHVKIFEEHVGGPIVGHDAGFGHSTGPADAFGGARVSVEPLGLTEAKSVVDARHLGRG